MTLSLPTPYHTNLLLFSFIINLIIIINFIIIIVICTIIIIFVSFINIKFLIY